MSLTSEQLGALASPRRYGTGPSPLRNRTTLRTAARLVALGPDLGPAADALGYASRSGFAGAFKRLVGLAPMVWAKLPTRQRKAKIEAAIKRKGW